MKRALLAIAILIAYPVCGQEVKHTTTKDLCREDRALWESQLNKPSASWSSVASDVDSKTLVLRASEMNDCSRVDTEQSELYVLIVHWLFAVVFNRETHFMIRHRLLEQFYQEDAAGAR